MRRRLRAVRSARLRHRAVPDRRDQNKKKRASKGQGARKCFCLGLIRCGNDADETYATADTCDFQIDVSAQLGGTNGQDQTYVRRIVLIVWDHGLQRQTQDAYQAYLSNGDARLGKEESEKPKRRKVPKF
jgi:hypothetical protein